MGYGLFSSFLNHSNLFNVQTYLQICGTFIAVVIILIEDVLGCCFTLKVSMWLNMIFILLLFVESLAGFHMEDYADRNHIG